MRIDEITGVKSMHSMSLDKLIQAFVEQTGYKELGSGKAAFVFKHPTKNEVIKFWVADKAYESFVNYAMANQNDPFMPKFLSGIKTIRAFHTRHGATPADIKYVRMEMLNPCKKFDWMGKVIGPDSFLFKAKHWACSVGDPNRDAELIRGAYGPDATEMPDSVKPFLQSLERVVKAVKTGDNINVDMHSKNIMQRPDGQVVIIDPVTDDESLDINKQISSLFKFFQVGVNQDRIERNAKLEKGQKKQAVKPMVSGPNKKRP